MRPETISSTQSLMRGRPGPVSPRRAGAGPGRSLPRRLGQHQLRGGAVRRPHDLEVAADPLAHGAGELDLRALEADRPEDRRVRALGDMVADRLLVQADLLDGLLEDLERRPAVR